MKRAGKFFGFAAATLLVCAGTVVAQQVPRFAVISDPHFYDTDLGTSGLAFETYLAQDRKMLRESEAILESAIEGIKLQNPDFVLISGDLTKDGELSSHEKFASHLEELEKEGIEVFVVPGNHDLNNTHAVSFHDEEEIPVDYVTPGMFTDIYGAFGYDQAIARDPNSLSYVAEPVPGVLVFGIDSCKYDTNIADDYPQTSGAISEARLEWILKKLNQARKQNKTVVGFMHHGILEHFQGQSMLYADYVVDDWQTVAKRLSDAGLRLMFTGHYHAHDITQSNWEENTLHDVETGSLVTWPSPYRMVDLHGNNVAAVSSYYVEEIDYDTGDLSFTEYAENFLYDGLTNIASYLLTLPFEHGGFALAPEEALKAAPTVARTFMAHYAGDEALDIETQDTLQGYLNSNDASYIQLAQALYSLWTDLLPADDSALLSLNPPITIEPLGTYATGVFDESAAEISAYDPIHEQLFVVNGDSKTIDILDLSKPESPALIGELDTSPYGASPNSVAVCGGMVAVALEAEIKQDNGSVAVFTTSGKFLRDFPAGALPDMVTFTPDCSYLLAANEGEPNDDYSVDPEGSVTIINLRRGIKRASVKTADFSRFNNKKDRLIAKGVRIFGPDATVSQDLEPEYITVLPHSRYAWVSLQENNAIAKINIRSGRVVRIYPLGVKDYGLSHNGIDASDRDDVISITPYNNVVGMYQPDAIAAYKVRGKDYIVTANEGDARDYDDFSEEKRVKKLDLDPDSFPDADSLQQDEVLGRLTVTTANGDVDGDGDFDKLYSFGARSFTIFKTTPRRLVSVFDSGDQFEQLTSIADAANFNSDNDENDSFDTRSDAKGPEPEGVVLGKVDGKTYAFVGLERVSGIMVYDITSPKSPQFVQYINNRDFAGDPEAGTAGDLGPEGLTFIPWYKSPNGKPLLVVTNEVSGSTTTYQINKRDRFPCNYKWQRFQKQFKKR